MPEVSTQYYLGDSLIRYVTLGDSLVATNPFTQDTIVPVPSIVTDGLVAYFDATNAASYPGSGTSWFNLVAGKPITASLVNGVTYSGGFLQTNGTNQYISIPVGSGDTLTAYNVYTAMGATRYADTSGNGRMMSGQSSRNWLLGHYNDTTLNYFAEGTITGIPGGPNDTNWRIYTGTGNTTTDRWDFYVNGVNSVTSSTGGSAGINGMEIGRQYNGTEYSSGSVAFIMIYNRVLSPAEVTQNYDVLKSKVGLT
jgi:hypothetical protein